METTVSLNGQSIITKEEAEKLPKEVLKTEKQWGYWTLSPYYFYSGVGAGVFYVRGSVYLGYLSGDLVYGTNGVRPVISLKSKTLKSGIMTSAEYSEKERINELVRSIRKRIKK